MELFLSVLSGAALGCAIACLINVRKLYKLYREINRVVIHLQIDSENLYDEVEDLRTEDVANMQRLCSMGYVGDPDDIV